MPYDINVADGKLGNWHRFDALDRAVVKDRSIILSVADAGASPNFASNAWGQIETIWNKLGGTSVPPRVSYFNREDLAKNEAGQVPGTMNTPVNAFNSSNLMAFYLDLDFDIGGSAPTGVYWEAVATAPTPGSPFNGTFTLTYPYQWFGYTVWAITGLTASTTYTVKAKLVNSFGQSANWSGTTSYSTI